METTAEKKQEIIPFEKYPISCDANGLVLNSIEAMYRWSAIIEKSGLAPDGLKTPSQIMVALQAGAELGMRPVKAMNSFCVVKGRPTLWGDAAIGLVLASGLCEDYSERVDGEGDKMVATCTTKRKGMPKAEKTFSAGQARNAGLWSKGGTWKSHPDQMLIYRARGFLLRAYYSDVLCGFHLKEEFDGIPDSSYIPDTPKRDDRKAVESTTPKTAAERVELLFAKFSSALDDRNLDEEMLHNLFLQWSSYLGGGAASMYRDPSAWTEVILADLETAIGNSIPAAILDMIPDKKEAVTQ